VVADLIAVNRELLEKLLARDRSHGQAAPPAQSEGAAEAEVA
jgi:hypothetical protein